MIRYSPTTTSHYHALLHVSMRDYMEGAAMAHAMWLRVPWPRSTLSRVSTRGN